jgi:hypothetical protein
MFGCSQKVKDSLVTMKNAQAHLNNQDAIGKAIAERSEFRTLVQEAQELVGKISYQVNRYGGCNPVKKRWVEGDIRKKIQTHVTNLNLKMNTIEGNHIQSIQLSQQNLATETQARLSEMVLESVAQLQSMADMQQNQLG